MYIYIFVFYIAIRIIKSDILLMYKYHALFNYIGYKRNKDKYYIYFYQYNNIYNIILQIFHLYKWVINYVRSFSRKFNT